MTSHQVWWVSGESSSIVSNGGLSAEEARRLADRLNEVMRAGEGITDGHFEPRVKNSPSVLCACKEFYVVPGSKYLKYGKTHREDECVEGYG
jgi:hypothetical protein